ncbi:hypothetical protein E4U42_003210 [Claviceps africana]|uniref:Extracelular serine carboxypeptidase n=1 Tax=Claviceps africana TaxID=83212 RepID=A0A8K0JCY5_9HYPO|nr:hypothetical protein E4U42_003210 [Claviceps africana]
MRNALALVALAVSQVAALTPGGTRLPAFFPGRKMTPGSVASLDTKTNVKEYNMSVPIDHFHNETKYEPHSDGFFNLRYLVDASHYKEGGPVILLHSGEFQADGRLGYLEHGIVSILTKATGGVGAVLEHRYYGTSWPTNDTDTASYRFLTTDQAIADMAYFSKNLRIPGLERYNLKAPATPHILYGGSYAGGVVAIARKLYPDLFWGAISSSGVTGVIDDFWQYNEATRYFAPGDCSPTIQRLVDIIDKQLLSRDQKKEREIKSLFGMQDLWNDEFASVLMNGVPSLQSTDWNPARDTTDFGTFCAVISSDAALFPSTEYLRPRVRSVVEKAGYAHEPMTSRMLNYIAYVKNYIKMGLQDTPCAGNKDLRKCMSPRLAEDDPTHSAGRSWLYQTCTEWGYFVNGASTPKDRLPMASRAVDVEYASYDCKSSFNITARPNVNIINKHGGFNFSYPRVAFIDGKQDPWRAGGPHAIGLPGRVSTPSEPFELIDWGVHHWDESDLSDDAEREPGLPPKQIVDIHRKEVEIVRHWLEEFKALKKGRKNAIEL